MWASTAAAARGGLMCCNSRTLAVTFPAFGPWRRTLVVCRRATPRTRCLGTAAAPGGLPLDAAHPSIGPWRRAPAACRRVASRPRCLGAAAHPTVTPSPSPSPARHPRATHTCPACGQRCTRPGVFERHLAHCCPDLVSLAAWREAVSAGGKEQARALEEAEAAEAGLRAAALALAFRTPGPDGALVKRTAGEVAAALGLPEPRVAAMLKLAMRAVPLPADDAPIDILFEDDAVLALAKPAGIITAPKHRFTGGSLLNRAIHYLGRPPFPVHRLDMFTSGVVVMAKSSAAAAGLHAQFRGRTARKRYLALTLGVPAEAAFDVDAAIGRHPSHTVARAAVEDGDPAFTAFRVLAAVGATDAAGAAPGCVAPPHALALLASGAALVSAAPRTGRTHQIRVHLAHAGHPIVGDDLYGAVPPWAARQMLHAASLEVVHPVTGEALVLQAPLPPDFVAALGALGLAAPERLPDVVDGGPAGGAGAAAAA